MSSPTGGPSEPPNATQDQWRALGDAIAARRAELGLSIEKAASGAGTSDTTWRQLESGQRRLPDGSTSVPNPRRDLLGRVAHLLGIRLVDIDDVLAGSATRFPAARPEDPLAGARAYSGIDVSGLPEEDLEFLRRQVEIMRKARGLDS